MISIKMLDRLRHFPLLYEVGVSFRDLRSYVRGRGAGTFAQHGEDQFLLRYFKGEGAGRYLDIGASHPYRLSNTYMLYTRGWRGVTVEPIPRLGRLHRQWRPKDTLLPIGVGRDAGCITFYEMTPSVLSTFDQTVYRQYVDQKRAVLHAAYEVEVLSINDVLERAFADGRIDFLSIDVEGLDGELLVEMNLVRFRPRLICVEINTEEARKMVEAKLAKSRYEVVTELGCNLFAQSLDN